LPENNICTKNEQNVRILHYIFSEKYFSHFLRKRGNALQPPSSTHVLRDKASPSAHSFYSSWGQLSLPSLPLSIPAVNHAMCGTSSPLGELFVILCTYGTSSWEKLVFVGSTRLDCSLSRDRKHLLNDRCLLAQPEDDVSCLFLGILTGGKMTPRTHDTRIPFCKKHGASSLTVTRTRTATISGTLVKG